MHLLENISLKKYNTFGLKNQVDQLIEIDNPGELTTFIREDWGKYPVRMILGGGSNVLFSGDFKGLILRPQLKGIELVHENKEEVFVKAMCGEVWDDFVNYCVEKGWGGLENLSQIPGNVGACPIQNIGAYGVEVKETIEQVHTIELSSGKEVSFGPQECEFGYRTSIFKTREKGKYLIYAVTFRLQKHPVLKTRYADVEHELEKYAQIDIKSVRAAISAIRWRKLPDPACIGNAGSFFKNPVITKSHFEQLKEKYPLIPGYPAGEQIIKVPAAWLIEQANFKGTREGEVGSSSSQPLVLVNYGEATGAGIIAFAHKIQDTIRDKFNIGLEIEVNIVN